MPNSPSYGKSYLQPKPALASPLEAAIVSQGFIQESRIKSAGPS
jgi:hypothetical protein